MKKIIITLLSLLTFHTASLAQNFSFRASVGYAMPFATATTDASGGLFRGTITRTTVNSIDYDEYNIKKASFTAGAHLALGIGYMFNEHVGADAALDFGVAPAKNVFDFNNVMVNKIPRNVEFIQKAAMPVMFTPSLVLQSGGKKLNLYSRFGVVLPLNTTIIWDRIFTTLPGYGAVTTDDETWEIKNKFSLGMSAAVGVQKKVSERIKISAELSILSMSIINKQAKLTKFTSNGQQYNISNEPDSVTTIIYSTNFKSTSDNYNHQPAYAQPFSNMALNISMTCSLGGGSKRRSFNRNESEGGKNFTRGHR